MDITIVRRHSKKCPSKDKGQHYLKCSGKRPCPLRAFGYDDQGHRVREALGTRDLARAPKKLEVILQRLHAAPSAAVRASLADAGTSFLEAHKGNGESTLKKYKRVVKGLIECAKAEGVFRVDAVTVEMIDHYRSGRDIGTFTWSKELPILRQFLDHCQARKWITENPARQIKPPRNAKPKPIEPYTREELVKIIAASNQIGRGPYERLRAYAMTLLFRYTALRISDVAVLQRSRVSEGEIFIRAEKNGKPVRLPVPQDLQDALDRLPIPRGASDECPFFFWTGHGTKGSAIRDIRRTMAAVFRKAGVAHAHPHKFRHTMAVEILVGGGGIEDVASILGDDPTTVRRHYAMWTTTRQERIRSLMHAVHAGTNLAHAQQQATTC